jgi:glycosyltransferase involved in cell wall biosynthesis
MGSVPMAMESPAVHSLLLVRNGVDHDARVLRAARVAEQTLGGTALILGVATAAAPAGATIVEGVPVLRLPARTPGLTHLVARLERITSRRVSGARPEPITRPPTGRMVAAQDARDVHGPDARRATAANGVQPVAVPMVSAAAAATPRLTASARVRRILSGLSFLRQAIAVARQTRPALVQANDWNTMWTGLAIKLGYGARLVYDSHELWPDRNGRWEWRPWLLAGEALFVRAADDVVTSSPGYAAALAARYRVPRPAIVRNIPERRSSAGLPAATRMSTNAAPLDPASYRPGARVPRSELDGPPSPPCVIYIGGLMPGRGLEQMIDALPHLPNVRLRAIGPGADRYRFGLLTRATAAGVGDRVELRAPVAPGGVQGALAGAAAGLCLIQPICRSYELSLPNKLFEYAAAGVPVLASDVPVIATLVRNEGLGEIVPSEGPGEIAAGLERLLEPSAWRQTVARVETFADAYDWSSEASVLARVYGRAGSGITP